jgi:hypothetical protein
MANVNRIERSAVHADAAYRFLLLLQTLLYHQDTKSTKRDSVFRFLGALDGSSFRHVSHHS